MKLSRRYTISFIILGLVFLLMLIDFKMENIKSTSFITSFIYSFLITLIIYANININKIKNRIKISRFLWGLIILSLSCFAILMTYSIIESYFPNSNMDFDFIILIPLFFFFIFFLLPQGDEESKNK